MMKWLFAFLMISGAAHAVTPWSGQCPTGTVASSVGCQEAATSPLAETDLVLGWQIGQASPHTRAIQKQQITGTSTVPTKGWFAGLSISDALGHFATVRLEFPTFAAFAAYKPSVFTAAAVWAGAPVVAHTAGYYAAGDGGGATYAWASASAVTADGLYYITPGGGASGRWVLEVSPGGADVRQLGVVVDGVTSADVKLAAAAAACGVYGTKLNIPAGQMVMNGTSSASVTVANCALSGVGRGTSVRLTSTTVKPFILGSKFAVTGMEFYYPNQTGAVVYQPLFSDDGVNGVNQGYINDVTIINAYAGLVATPTIDWSNLTISDSWIYAVNDSIRQNATGDSWRISNVHWTHGPWATIVGYPTVAAYLNAADQTNTILHITSGAGVTMAIDNSTAFAWRYGIKVDSGGKFINSKVDVVWDGVMTHIDTSAGGCMGSTIFSGTGLASYVPVFSSSGAVSARAQSNPMFNLGANAGSCAGPVLTNVFPTTVFGSFLVSAGQNADISNSTLLFGRRNDGTDYYAVHVTANGGGTGIYVKGSKIQPDASTGLTKMHGVVADVAMNIFTVKDNDFLNVNEVASLVLVGGGNQLIGNTARQTAGTVDLIYTGTGPLQWGNNLFDKPPVATITGGGAGATVSGTLSGVIQIGSTNPTTMVTLTLPFPTPTDACTFTSSQVAFIYGGHPSSPAAYTLTASADIHGTQVYFLCSGQQ